MLLCAAVASAFAAACSSPSDEGSSDASVTEQATGSSSESGEMTVFEKALAQVDEDLAPLPAKDTGAALGAIESTLSNSFWVTMQEGYEDTAAEYGVTIDVQATDSDTDTEGQLNILENMLLKDYAAIAVSPLTGDCLISGIVQANQDGVAIITTGNEVDEEALTKANGTIAGKITVDFKSQGTLGAEYIIENNTSDSKKVAIIAGNEGGTQADARRDGAKEAFEAADYEIVSIEQCDFDVQKAYDAAAIIIDANPDLVGFTCGNDDMALGVVKALQERDMKDQVMVVGVDFTAEAKEAIKEGTYDATVAMAPYLMGREAVIIMLKYLEGQDVSEIGDSTPMAVVTAENVASMDDWH